MGPIRIRHEGKRVEMRLHITSAAGIGIVAPHATDIVSALKDYEVFKAFLLQPDRSSNTAKAAADNCYLHVLHPYRFIDQNRRRILKTRAPENRECSWRGQEIVERLGPSEQILAQLEILTLQ